MKNEESMRRVKRKSPSTRRGCTPSPNTIFLNFAEVLSDYKDFKSDPQSLSSLKKFFHTMGSLEEVIEKIANRDESKRHDHQLRLPKASLVKAKSRLKASAEKLKKIRSFDELLELCRRCIGEIKDIGELAIYDFSLRLGFFLKIYPTKIYLHAGTRKGALALGLEFYNDFLNTKQLPVEFRKLKPYEAEDVLCIYKHHFPATLRRASRGVGRS